MLAFAARCWPFCLAAVASFAFAARGESQANARLEPVAETKLLMEGLAHPNFRSLDRMLGQEAPDDVQAWRFARGQALLLAETANLLMLRPPKSPSLQAIWFDKATDLRQRSSQLADSLGRREFDRSRAGLVDVANSCNRCHQTFRIKIEIAPFAQGTPGKN